MLDFDLSGGGFNFDSLNRKLLLTQDSKIIIENNLAGFIGTQLGSYFLDSSIGVDIPTLENGTSENKEEFQEYLSEVLRPITDGERIVLIKVLRLIVRKNEKGKYVKIVELNIMSFISFENNITLFI